MINVKLLVLFVFLKVNESVHNYCEICRSHTLCLYKNPGPSPSCKSYDKAALLTKEDARTIIDKINQRRNFVALGLAKNVPSAANMNKVVWSDELATFAQRWVDQCDVATRPAAEDVCRDLADSSVGQNIATIVGLSPGLKVKSFVEMWFMESLYYTGSVTYFNQSEASKTNYFTQLIWADTKYVGCGKARFNIDDKGTMVDRLVCNFAPRGNILGKPIYTIGYPATQCNEDCRMDDTFSGLCKAQEVTTLNTASTAAVSSLLRIVNLPNRSEHNIDLLRNYKHLETDNDETNLVRHQKMRHITNNSHFLRHELESNPIIHEATNIPVRHNVIPFQHTINHSQNVHGAVYRTRSPNDDFIKHDNVESFRKHYISRQCTRIIGFDNTRNYYNNQNENDQCTRRLKGNYYILTTPPTKITASYGPICECNSQKTTSHPRTTQFTCDVNCCCLNTNNCGTADHRRQLTGQIANYDNMPDFEVHTKDETNQRQFLRYLADSSTHVPTPIVKDEEISDADYYTTKTKTFYFNKIKAQRQYTERQNRRRKPTNFYHLINPFGRRKRLKRQIENPSAYPASFWQDDEYNMQPQLKSLRYTTLSDRRRKFRTKQKMQYDTEPITIKLKDVSLPEHDITEKFLSFDELMHLRRNFGRDSGFDARRDSKKKATTKAKAKTATTKAKAAVTKAKTAATKAKTAATKAPTTKAATTIPTTKTTVATLPIINTRLYKPLKHCTRKVTCTWTAPTVTGKDGQVFTKGRGISRTPPGYVEGCSRTSTCTREHMNRNKQPTTADSAEEVTNPDEDYCERRSLDLKPRSSEDDALEKKIETSIENDYTTSLKYESTTISQEDCTCDSQEVRKKRSIRHKRPKSKEDKPIEIPITYDDLYFVILGKILRLLGSTKIKNKFNGCLCNKSNDLYLYNHYYLLTFLLLYMF